MLAGVPRWSGFGAGLPPGADSEAAQARHSDKRRDQPLARLPGSWIAPIGPAARRNHPRRRQKKRGKRKKQGSLNSRDEAPPAGGFHFTRFRLPFALMEEGCLMVRVGIAGIGFMGVTHYK